MSGRLSRLFIIWSIVVKDLREFSRNRFWVMTIVIGLAAGVGTYWALPTWRPQWTITVGVSPSHLATAAKATLLFTQHSNPDSQEAALAKGIRIVPFADEGSLRAGLASRGGRQMLKHRISAGIVIPPDFFEAARSGRTMTVTVLLKEDLPEGVKTAVASIVREVAHALRAIASRTSPIKAMPVRLGDLQTATLGLDLRGGNLAPPAIMQPLQVLIILIFGAVMLAGLISVEIEQQTVKAILVTRAHVGDVLAAKCITGMILSVSWTILFLLATWRSGVQWGPTIVLVVLGAAMMSAMGLIAGAGGMGFSETMTRTFVLTIPLSAPAVTHMGTPPLVVRMLPSYGLIESLKSVIQYGRGWTHIMPQVMVGLAWTAAAVVIGLVVLKRKVASL